MDKLKSALYIDSRDYELVQPEACEQNRKLARYFLMAISVIMAALCGLSFLQEHYSQLRVTYIIAFALSLFLLIFLDRTSEHGAKSTTFVVYMGTAIYLLYGMELARCNPDDYSVTFICILLITSMVFIVNPGRFAVFIIAFIVAYIVMVINVKTQRVMVTEIVNVVCFGSLSILINHILVKVKIDNYILERKLKYLGENDKLTDLHNRNLYEMQLAEYEKKGLVPPACVFVDVNGLHELNNTQGHEAGDKMLRFVADTFKTFYGTVHTYRIGGDEFVAFVFDKTEAAVKEVTERFRREIIAGKYSVSLGLEFSKSALSAKDMIKAAEQNMYLDKKAYYENAHIDRRNERYRM